MKAAQYFGKEDVRVVDVAEPNLKDGEVLIEISWCGICGSDLHEYIMGPMVIPTKDAHPLTNEKLPVTLGHEFCGRVKQASENSNLKSGTAVVADPRLYCRSCNRCGIKETVSCDKWGFRGLSGGGGGFSQYVAIHESQIYPIPDSLLPYGALVEPLAVAWHAVKRAGDLDFTNKTVLIVGGGPIGIALLLVLRAFNCKKIIVSEPTDARRKQNEELADHTLNPMEQNIGDECRALTDGEGVDISFDAAGVGPGFHAACDALKYKGLYVNVAGWEQAMPNPYGYLMMKEISMTASRAYNDNDFADTVKYFAEGKFKGFEKMVTSRIGLAEISSKGFEALVKHKDDHIKILVTPQESLLS
ncbi:chlorophyll synthesis pathway protein BchC [Verruconis gallopava]|uniref:Chlorophyll synthesis pathway protein BchC n=1 Tax=Verruconis gallopava TaxID=253628 RepID=A0A0D2A304_9PEZI|nr:chlorophyll synthesis pathway protein BchC [Verruconis gallopava]KIW01153.1 chlorophyll synthesis pathway protein BchC [Verruconis gallopava]